MKQDDNLSFLIDAEKIKYQRIREMYRTIKKSYLFKYKNIGYSFYNESVNLQPEIALPIKPIASHQKSEDIYFNKNLNTDQLLKNIYILEQEVVEPLIENSIYDSFVEELDKPNITIYKSNAYRNSIKYKKVDANYFNSLEGYHANDEEFSFAGKYISKELISKLTLGKVDTTVVNIGTGDGKSVTARHLINFYARNGYIVIVASPFIVLTNRDYENIFENKDDHLKVVYYLNLGMLNVLRYSQADIHIMTINTLLGNPGDPDDPDKKQSLLKQTYLEELIVYCKNNNKEVILFFDEIHAGISNFKGKLIENLDKWNGLVKKIFVFSATFTEASNVVLEYLSRLTEKRLTIYNCERKKFPVQANLHIHITERKYTSKDLSPINFIGNIVQEALKRNEKVNILVATQSLALALSNSDSNQPLAQYLSSLDINVIIGKNSNSNVNKFDPDKINIGTVFNTGISITDPKNTFIIITPVIIGPDSQKLASIFMEGAPSIIQAFARPRNGGNIHVFMHNPSNLVRGYYRKVSLPDYLKNLGNTRYIDLNNQSEIIEAAYKAENSHLQRLSLFTGIKGHQIYQYSKKEYILSKSQYELSSNFEIFGKKVSPYIIWAACNDQFTNCTLKTINLIAEPSVKVEIKEETIIPDLNRLLSDKIQLKILPLNDKDALAELFKDIYKSNIYGGMGSNIILWKGRPVSKEQAVFHPSISRALISILYQFKYDEKDEFDLSNYIHGNILLSRIYHYSDKKEKRNNLKAAYLILDGIRNSFLNLYNDNQQISHEIIDDRMEEDLCTVLHELRENDFYIRYKIYSFLQTYNFSLTATGVKHQNRNVEQRRKVLFRALLNLFFECKTKVKKIDGKSQRIKVIVNEKSYEDNFLDLNLIGREELLPKK